MIRNFLCKLGRFQRCRNDILLSESSAIEVSKRNLSGMAVAPLTPFDINGNLDLSTLHQCGKYFKEQNFNGLFVNGTLGEGLSMANGERKQVAEKWKEVADSERLYMILHIGAGNLTDTVELAKHAVDIGVDAIAALPPTYHKPNNIEQLIKYLEKISEAAPSLPLLYYEYNIATGIYLDIPFMLAQAKSRVPTLYGLKHTSPELASALNCANVSKGKFKVFFGTESLYLPSLSLGIPDVITTPIMGEFFYKIKCMFEQGDISLAQKEQNRAQVLANILQVHGGGIGAYKATFKILTGIDVGYPRLPLESMPIEKEQRLTNELISKNFLVHSD